MKRKIIKIQMIIVINKLRINQSLEL